MSFRVSDRANKDELNTWMLGKKPSMKQMCNHSFNMKNKTQSKLLLLEVDDSVLGSVKSDLPFFMSFLKFFLV